MDVPGISGQISEGRLGSEMINADLEVYVLVNTCRMMTIFTTIFGNFTRKLNLDKEV